MINGTEMDFNDTDALLYKVLSEARSLKEFLERVFGFLFRCTDFYRVNKAPVDSSSSKSSESGEGPTSELLMRVFENWRRADSDEAYEERKEKLKSRKTNRSLPQKDNEEGAQVGERVQPPSVDADSYNGAQCDGYRWAQTHTDLDIKVAVGAEVRSAREVKVEITSTSMSVKVGSGADKRTLVEGSWRHEIRPGDTIWTFLPGQYVHVVVEKRTACWWDALLCHETALDVTKMHRTRSLGDLPEAERDAVITLMEKEARERNDKGRLE